MSPAPLILRNAESVAVEIGADYGAVKTAALETARGVQAVTDAFSQELAVESLTQLATIEKTVEASRQTVKAPILDIGRKIDTAAKNFLTEILTEAGRIKKLISDFQAEERRKAAEAEKLRRAEEERLAEEKRKADEEARKAAEKTILAQNQAEAAKAEIERIEAEKSAAKLQEQQRVISKPVAAPVHTVGLRVSEVWKFEVTDIAALYKACPDLCDLTVKASAINALLRNGAREIPGLRIFSETEATVSTRK